MPLDADVTEAVLVSDGNANYHILSYYTQSIDYRHH